MLKRHCLSHPCARHDADYCWSAAATRTTPTMTRTTILRRKISNGSEKDINILLGYGAGGDSDVCTRYMADALSKELGVNVVVTNMGGANASLAANEIMNSTDPEYNSSRSTRRPSALTLLPV